MYNCWLSPQGHTYYCEIHQTEAVNIVKNLGLSCEFETYRRSGKCFSEEAFLEQKGWIKYCNHPPEFGIPVCWVIPDFVHLTQAQIDKIYELTGKVFENENLLGPYFVRSFF